MNIALGAVLIFILLIPPIAFYVSYTFGRHTRGGLKFSFLDGILASAIFSLLVHAAAILLIGKEIRFDILLKVAGGELKDLESKISNREFTHSLKQFAWYNFVVLLIMILLGQFMRWISQKSQWHFKFEILRIYNRWWYLFNGFYLEEEDSKQVDYDNPIVHVVADTNAGTVIYTGVLTGYVCNGDELDRIYLKGAIRRDFILQKDRPDTPAGPDKEMKDTKDIPGQFLTIAYSQIKNMNLQFITFDETEEYIEDFEDIPDELDFEDETSIEQTEGPAKETPMGE